MTELINEMFALRGGEYLQLADVGEPFDFAVMLRTVKLPDGPKVEKDHKGDPVESLAIIGAKIERRPEGQGESGWQWMYISPATKEYIGNFLIGVVEPDQWNYLRIEGGGRGDNLQAVS